MKWSLIDSDGIVQNIIIYDGTSKYTPPANLTLEQVNDWIEINQSKDTPEPVIK